MANDETCVFAIDFTQEGLTAAFIFPGGVEEGTAGFDLTDFQAGEGRALDKFTALIMAKARTASAPIRAVVLTLPCDITADRRTVVSFSRAAWLNGRDLPQHLSSALGLPVVMERRSIAFLSYDMAMLGLPADSLAVGCYIDIHYDSAIWHRGAPIRGRNGMAGNIAHMTIHDREDNCFCGKSGCVDLYGAGVRLRQLHSMIFPDTPLGELFERHGSHPILQDYVAMMAYPIAIEVNVLDPDYLILGGTVPSMPGFPRDQLEEHILLHTYRPAARRDLTFLASAASMTPGVVCAAQYALLELELG